MTTEKVVEKLKGAQKLIEEARWAMAGRVLEGQPNATRQDNAWYTLTTVNISISQAVACLQPPDIGASRE